MYLKAPDTGKLPEGPAGLYASLWASPLALPVSGILGRNHVPAAVRTSANTKLVCYHPPMLCARSASSTAKKRKLGTLAVSTTGLRFQNRVLCSWHPRGSQKLWLYCHILCCRTVSFARLLVIYLALRSAIRRSSQIEELLSCLLFIWHPEVITD